MNTLNIVSFKHSIRPISCHDSLCACSFAGQVFHAGVNTKNEQLSRRAISAALRAYREAATLAPDLASARYGIGSTLYVLGRIEEANEAFEDASQIQQEE